MRITKTGSTAVTDGTIQEVCEFALELIMSAVTIDSENPAPGLREFDKLSSIFLYGLSSLVRTAPDMTIDYIVNKEDGTFSTRFSALTTYIATMAIANKAAMYAAKQQDLDPMKARDIIASSIEAVRVEVTP